MYIYLYRSTSTPMAFFSSWPTPSSSRRPIRSICSWVRRAGRTRTSFLCWARPCSPSATGTPSPAAGRTPCTCSGASPPASCSSPHSSPPPRRSPVLPVLPPVSLQLRPRRRIPPAVLRRPPVLLVWRPRLPPLALQRRSPPAVSQSDSSYKS